MFDFLMVTSRMTKNGTWEIYPKFIIKTSSDLMIRGGDFYAIWTGETGLWSTDEQDAIRLIDRELDRYAEENKARFEAGFRVLHMWDAESGMIDKWHKYCQKQMRDHYRQLDETLIFSNTDTKKEDYASKKLDYSLEDGACDAWDELTGTLYSEDERAKLEWAIGAVVSGDSRKIQKFLVLYGAAGTGKSTILNIIQQLFEGYISVFDAKALGSSNNSFALEAFKKNPLVAIQHDGDLSRIEDNTRLNSLVSHEWMTVNEKFKSTYESQFKCFLFMGTNKPVRITDAKSGLIRRLIDVKPTGEKIKHSRYTELMNRIPFEKGRIAKRCFDVYEENPSRYDNYIPTGMIGATNDFFGFIEDNWFIFKRENETSLKTAWDMYKQYCEDAKVAYPYSRRQFMEELKNYFDEYFDRKTLDDGTRIRSYYSGFKAEVFMTKKGDDPEEKSSSGWIIFDGTESAFDKAGPDWPAQYAGESGSPSMKWDNVTTKLKDLDTRKVHYVRVPENHIVIDFDIPDENGAKSLQKNLSEANKWPPTYAEVSKSGQGIHLHYIYTGDVTKLAYMFAEHIEIKVFTGKSSLRRRRSLFNSRDISTIGSGLPLKEVKNTVTEQVKLTESRLKAIVLKCLKKEVPPYHTKPNCDMIFKVLTDAHDQGLHYDLTDLKPNVIAFAASSTNQSDYCLSLVTKMPFASDEPEENKPFDESEKDVFFDVEVFPNLFVICWKYEDDPEVHAMVNPSPVEVGWLCRKPLIGFNNRKYDNHILYAAEMGAGPFQLYQLSQSMIKDKVGFHREAYNLSKTDILDYASNKQSLKLYEIEMDIHHQELGLDWDKPVPHELWDKVVEYCKNDVVATEAAHKYLHGDYISREMLADIAGMTVNDTTNQLTARIVFGKERRPQGKFRWRDLALPVRPTDEDDGAWIFDAEGNPTDRKWHKGDPLPDGWSVKPFFPGYIYDQYKPKKDRSTYRGVTVGEGGYVYAETGKGYGMYGNVALLDIASMHPSSIIAEQLFGPEYTRRFEELVRARIAIKHKDFETVKKMMDGKLGKYLDDEKAAKQVSKALKIPINAAYGQTAASFENPFRDPNNIDNIVAKRGALFMINLRDEVQKRGYIVAHIKTDSIKIPDADPEIIKFVMDYGKKFGYSFEHEATYERMCLVNDAVYIAKFATKEQCEALYGYCPDENAEEGGHWTATGAQFQVPYVFKTMFTKEDICFKDMRETRSVTTALCLDMNEGLPEGEHRYRFVGRVGLFCPVMPGFGGGELLRKDVDEETGEAKYSYANRSKGWRWQEAEVLETLHLENTVDVRYYLKLVDEASDEIREHGDLNWFVSDAPYVKGMLEREKEE